MGNSISSTAQSVGQSVGGVVRRRGNSPGSMAKVGGGGAGAKAATSSSAAPRHLTSLVPRRGERSKSLSTDVSTSKQALRASGADAGVPSARGSSSSDSMGKKKKKTKSIGGSEEHTDVVVIPPPTSTTKASSVVAGSDAVDIEQHQQHEDEKEGVGSALAAAGGGGGLSAETGSGVVMAHDASMSTPSVLATVKASSDDGDDGDIARAFSFMSASSRKKRKHDDELLEAANTALAAGDQARTADLATAQTSGAAAAAAAATVTATAAASTAAAATRVAPAVVGNAAVSAAAPADEDEEDIASDMATVAASDEYTMTAAGVLTDAGVIAEPMPDNAAAEAVRYTTTITAAAGATAIPIQRVTGGTARVNPERKNVNGHNTDDEELDEEPSLFGAFLDVLNTYSANPSVATFGDGAGPVGRTTTMTANPLYAWYKDDSSASVGEGMYDDDDDDDDTLDEFEYDGDDALISPLDASTNPIVRFMGGAGALTGGAIGVAIGGSLGGGVMIMASIAGFYIKLLQVRVCVWNVLTSSS